MLDLDLKRQVLYQEDAKNVTIVGLGGAGALLFLSVVEKMIEAHQSNKRCKPVHLTIIDPALDVVDNTPCRPKFRFHGSWAINNRNSNLDRAFILNSPPDELPGFPLISSLRCESRVRSDVGDYLNQLISEAVEKLNELKLPLTWCAVSDWVSGIKKEKINHGEKTEQFLIETESTRIRADEVIVSVGSQPNFLPFRHLVNSDRFFFISV